MLHLNQENSVAGKFDAQQYKALQNVYVPTYYKWAARILIGALVLLVVILFLPWTQNIIAQGTVTTLSPAQRPQTVQSLIAGRIEKWYKQEGDFVKRGDTILYISEVKTEYFDTLLAQRTLQQVKAKERAVQSYGSKVDALDKQIGALNSTLQYKLNQARNYVNQARLKITGDSAALVAIEVERTIAQQQLTRTNELYGQGLKSLTELEAKRQKFQEMDSKAVSAAAKLAAARNDYTNALTELNSLDAQYRDKLAKAESDKFSSLSDRLSAENDVIKLQNMYANYAMRAGFYYVTAPQDGYITRAIKVGIGELIKEGEDLVSIAPDHPAFAVEMYIAPVDIPLIQVGNNVRLIFDGFPAFVFSGWQGMSVGVFDGKVYAIDRFIDPSGKYRILITPNKNAVKKWPPELRIGLGAQCYALLNDVPVWYELWRNINGFPADFYGSTKADDKNPMPKEEKNDKESKPTIKPKY